MRSLELAVWLFTVVFASTAYHPLTMTSHANPHPQTGGLLQFLERIGQGCGEVLGIFAAPPVLDDQGAHVNAHVC